MELDFLALLQAKPQLILFVILGGGYLLGRIQLGPIPLGSTAGVLITALSLGQFHFQIPDGIGDVGFMVFIYAVGLQAGPRFLRVVLDDGKKYIALAVFVAGTACLLSAGLAYGFGFQPGISAGILAGALTSTPTLVAAEEVVRSGALASKLADLSTSLSTEAILQNMSTAYAITYLFGLIGLLIFIRLLPDWFKLDLPTEATRLAQAHHLQTEDLEEDPFKQATQSIKHRVYQITEEAIVGTTIQALEDRGHYRIQKLKRTWELKDLQIQKLDTFPGSEDLEGSPLTPLPKGGVEPPLSPTRQPLISTLLSPLRSTNAANPNQPFPENSSDPHHVPLDLDLKSLIDPTPMTQLKVGDRIAVMGSLEGIQILSRLVGSEVEDESLSHLPIETRRVIVTHAESIGIPFGDLEARVALQRSFLVRLSRFGVNLPLSDPNLRIQKRDVLMLVGQPERLDRLTAQIGHAETAHHQTDLLTSALGIAVGFVIGSVSITLGDWSVSLGTAGGLLLSGIGISYLRSIDPRLGQIPPAARWLMIELGLLLFIAQVGIRAGNHLLESLTVAGPAIFVSGVIVTIVSLLAGYAYGLFVLKLNPVLLLGALTGSMTSTLALNIVTKAANSSIPILGYVGTYTFANVLLTLVGALIMRL